MRVCVCVCCFEAEARTLTLNSRLFGSGAIKDVLNMLDIEAHLSYLYR